MTAQLIDGKKISQQILQNLAVRVQQRLDNQLRRPCLAVVLVGEDPASAV
ncbi:MAG: bifunctional methylenetetrahydrofolate dehydrogenase/methenyltetrahydrofolate cyclohydrolase, partial [Snodgrassella sp.]|nr:bifunctional methylenetetrahydrofolate dehydrogenase/methenyltetrahydrofolate cyclohydrolase [Snodgrassella sp.]